MSDACRPPSAPPSSSKETTRQADGTGTRECGGAAGLTAAPRPLDRLQRGVCTTATTVAHARCGGLRARHNARRPDIALRAIVRWQHVISSSAPPRSVIRLCGGTSPPRKNPSHTLAHRTRTGADPCTGPAAPAAGVTQAKTAPGCPEREAPAASTRAPGGPSRPSGRRGSAVWVWFAGRNLSQAGGLRWAPPGSHTGWNIALWVVTISWSRERATRSLLPWKGARVTGGTRRLERVGEHW